MEPGRGVDRLDAVELVERLADLLERGVDPDLGLGGEQGVEQAGLRVAEPDVAVLGGPQVHEHPVLA